MMRAQLLFLGLLPLAFLGTREPTAGRLHQDSRPTWSYIGVNKCKVCHFQQYKGWRKTRMAKAFESLLPGEAVKAKRKYGLDPKVDYTQHASCLSCHTTGYGERGGYPALVSRKKWTKAELGRAARMEGVQCEACHGPGSLTVAHKRKKKDYRRADLVKLGMLVPKTQCRDCHNTKSPAIGKDYKFDYDAVWKDRRKLHKHLPLKLSH